MNNRIGYVFFIVALFLFNEACFCEERSEKEKLSVKNSSESVYSGYIPAGKVEKHSINEKDGYIEFTLSKALLRIYPLSENIVRFRYVKDRFSDAPSYAISETPASNSFRLNETDSAIEITTGTSSQNYGNSNRDLKISIEKKSSCISISDSSRSLLNSDEPGLGVLIDGNEMRSFKTLFPDENFYGLGEKTRELNRKGKEWIMWNSDVPAYSCKDDPLYLSIPFFLSERNGKWYGIFLDNTYRTKFSMGNGNGRFYSFGAEKGELDYYFISGKTPKEVIAGYSRLTGRMSLPPLWALGFQQSKWSYASETKIRSIAKSFRDNNIPCDVLYLDIDYMDEYKVFTWNPKTFPKPEKLISDLKKDGFKVVTIIDPGVKAAAKKDGCTAHGKKVGDSDLSDEYPIAREGLEKDYFAKYPDGEYYIGEVWPSWAYFPDFTNPGTRTWWGEKLASFLKLGVSGFWNDMNEPAAWGGTMPDVVRFHGEGFGGEHKKIHNVYALQMAKATSEALEKYSEKRHFVLTRAGFSGIQKYSAVWTGDNVASSDHLELACRMLLSMGISGVPFTGSDVGGFAGYPTGELAVRWFQFGALCPFFRAHGEINQPDKEPFAFGDYIGRLVKEAINLRYKLLPFIYTEFYQCSMSGIPIIRPMFVEFPDDRECFSDDCQHQYMFGANMLVAPVLRENVRFKKFYLPSGKWFEFDTGKEFEGNKWHIVDAPLEKIPLFVREGAVIPMRSVQNYTDEKKFEELELFVSPGNSLPSKSELYVDDGNSKKYRNGEFALFRLIQNKNDNYQIEISKASGNSQTDLKRVKLRIPGMQDFRKILLNGSPLLNVKEISEKREKPQSFYEINNNWLEIIVPFCAAGMKFEIEKLK
ncbi:MAG: glycoside hydrolase family 31 protein [Candidatus Riflebacteria bacterium]|nr:glycoside hydrolase family 31 protein [Candidatus Riflebacteria bacterium]